MISPICDDSDDDYCGDNDYNSNGGGVPGTALEAENTEIDKILSLPLRNLESFRRN
jgi:hypothetical protein